MEIERRGGMPHANLARSRIAGVGQVGRRQIVERGRRAMLDRPHPSDAIAISTRFGPRITPPGLRPCSAPSRQVHLDKRSVGTEFAQTCYVMWFPFLYKKH